MRGLGLSQSGSSAHRAERRIAAGIDQHTRYSGKLLCPLYIVLSLYETLSRGHRLGELLANGLGELSTGDGQTQLLNREIGARHGNASYSPSAKVETLIKGGGHFS